MNTSPMIRTVAIILTVSLGGCATPQQSMQGQNILQQALAREASLTGSYPASPKDRFFSATISGSASPKVVAHEAYYQVTVPIASETPAECFVYHEALDSASTLNKLINVPLADMTETRIIKIDAGTFGHRPYLYQEKLYITDQKVAGVLKGIVIPFDTSLLACLHDTAGYSATFREMAASFAHSLQLHDTHREDLNHEEILVWKLGDMNIGFTVHRAGTDAEGDIKSTVETAVIIPRSEQEVITHDEYNITFEEPGGELINGRYAEAENGEIKISVSLDRTMQGNYQVEGVFQGKEINAPLEASSGLVGPYYQHREIIRAANTDDGQPRALSLDTYVPTASPLQTLVIDVNPTGKRIDGLPEYEMLFSGFKVTGVVDDKGQKSMTVKMGSLDLQLTRAFINSHH